MTRTYGWKKQKPDSRDKYFTVPYSLITLLVTKVDLSDKMPPVFDQGQLGSCTANGICAALMFSRAMQGLPTWVPSRLFLYWLERSMEGDTNADDGAEIRDGIKATNTNGVCREVTWPYDVTKYADRPTSVAFFEAGEFESVLYEAIDNTQINQIKGALAGGLPVVCGFNVYASFESDEVAKTGIVNMPLPNEEMVGGHAVVICGYDDLVQRFLVQNSWGSEWGIGGRFTIPYNYLTDPNLSSDYWVIQTIKETPEQKQEKSGTGLWQKIKTFLGMR